MAVITVQNLTKYYGKVRGVEDLSFTVEEGEIFGFIGPNGAGKTTTIRLLLGLIFPTRGQASIFGRDVLTDGVAIRRQVGYLPGEVYYYRGMKVGALLEYAAGFYPGDHRHRIRELAERLDLDLTRRVDELSFGNRKKVGIVQSLLHRPRLVFMDEPTSGLDPLIQQRFFDLLREENRRGMTVFFSSHVLSEVQRLCTRVGIIRQGQMVEVAEVEALRRRSYKRVRVEGEAIPPDALQMPGVRQLERINGGVRFYFQGDVNLLLQRLAALPLRDVSIEEPTLEEIFMHYYTGEH